MSILLFIGMVIFVVSFSGYFYSYKLNKENTSRLKKDQKAVLKKKSKVLIAISHFSLIISIILVGISLIQQTSSKYNIENLNYNAEINITNDKDYGGGHSEAPIKYEMKITTSGTHSPHDLKYGFYKEKPTYEKLVHNLEHGDIIIYYRPNANADLIERVNNLAHYQRAGSGILAVPNDENQQMMKL